jgi:chromosomal replication initiation ATPase DnaA
MAAPSAAASPTAERILVAVRLRPLNEDVDRAGGDACVWDAAPDGRTLRLDAAAVGKAAKGAPASYAFERVFGPGASNAAVYHACASPLVRGALAGVNCALLAYGQTGSGKTYTMNAMVAAAAEELFALTASARDRDFTVSVNALEVYNEARAAPQRCA